MKNTRDRSKGFSLHAFSILDKSDFNGRKLLSHTKDTV